MMDRNSIVHWAVIGLVGLFFIGNGAFELTKWRSFVDDFTRWGYPRYWPLVTCVLKIIFGVLMFVPIAQTVGLAGAAVVVAAGVGTLALHREPDTPKAAAAGAVILIVIAVALLTRPA
jgi:hypothetical protein